MPILPIIQIERKQKRDSLLVRHRALCTQRQSQPLLHHETSNSFLHCVSRAQLSLLISPLSLIQRRVRSQCRSVRVCVSVRRTSRRFSSLVALARVRGWARQVLPLAWAWLARDGEAPSTIQLVNWGEAGARGGMM